MKINRIFSIFIISCILTGFLGSVKVSAAEENTLGLPEFPVIESNNIVVMDADSREVLFARNPDLKSYPASTTKLLTALLVLENCGLQDVVTYSANAVNSIEYGDANASISEGEELTVEQSLYCLLLRSANEVAYGLAEHVSGNVSSFSTLMNSKAESLGAYNTHFTNASGLTDQFHYTTPYDMALIASACFNNKELMKVAGYGDMYIIPPTNKSSFTRYYTPRFEMLEGGDYAYEYACGGKTGYTDAAGNCLVSFAEKDGLRLVCVVFNSGSATRYNDSKALFDYYLNNYKKIYIDEFDSEISNADIDLLNLTLELSSKDSVSLGFKENAYLLVPNKVQKDGLTTIATYSDSPGYVGEEGGFACLSFFYENTNVGNATVFIKNSHNTGNVYDDTGVINRAEYFYINIWYIVGGIVLIGIIITIVIIVNKRKWRYKNYISRNLRF